jgi:hypothetical protein
MILTLLKVMFHNMLTETEHVLRIYDTVDTFSCLSQNQQFFCNTFYKETCRHFCDKDEKPIHLARISPLSEKHNGGMDCGMQRLCS